MNFKKYIKMLNIITIPVLIRKNSRIPITKAQKICVKRVNRVADKNPQYNVWLELTDLRDGNKYTVFSKAMMAAFDIEQQVNRSLDMTAIRQAIENASPENIRRVVREELKGLRQSSENIAETLLKNSSFVSALKPTYRSTFVDIDVLKKAFILRFIKRVLSISTPKRFIDIQVIKHESQ